MTIQRSVSRIITICSLAGLLTCSASAFAGDPVKFSAEGDARNTVINDEGMLFADLFGDDDEFRGELEESLAGFFGQAAVGVATLRYDDDGDGEYGEKGDSRLEIMFADAVGFDPVVSGAWTVIYGTGRFAGADGGGTLSGTVVELDQDPTTIEFDLELNGTLTY